MLLMEAAGVNYRDPTNNGTEGLAVTIVAEEALQS